MKKTIIPLFSIALLTLCSGCSLFNKGTKVQATEQDLKENAVVPDDRQQVIPDRTPQTLFKETDLDKGAVRSDWEIVTVFGKEVKSEEPAYLKFEPSNGAIYGNNGCNTINGRYVYDPAEKSIKIENLITTMRACPGELMDTEINQALAHTVRYGWSATGADHFLAFYDNSGREVMTLKHQEFDFLNGVWQVEEIGDTKIDNPDMKLVIDIDQQKIHGNTGCNILNGKVETNPKTVNSISFFALATTKMACEDGGLTERELLVALEDAIYAKPIGTAQVLLLNSSHQPVMTLRRVEG